MFKKPIVCENENSCASEFDNSWIACDTNNGVMVALILQQNDYPWT
ncbi:MAG: hypothetical protein CM15mP45_10480 [Deltaproteobacteria bacterium]|nr:MAG: hypothetical protein CM15mP45_10480 [Deltaproteobacteria bacterium]